MTSRFFRLFARTLPLAATLLCLTFFALAEPPTPRDLAVFSQSDVIFDSPLYNYRNQPYRASACGPSSLANGFSAALGITDRQEGADIALELLNIITNGSDYANMNPSFLSVLPHLSPSAYPALTGALNQRNCRLAYFDSNLSAGVISEALSTQEPFARLLVTNSSEVNSYATLCSVAYQLYHTGHRDATITLALLSAGTDKTDGAFRTTAGGHYVSLYVPVREFCESGALYLLESYPRCISGEIPGEKYQKRYDFVIITNETLGLRPFKDRCRIERLTDAILRITPQEPLGGALLMNRQPIDALTAYERYLRTMNFCSGCKLLVYVPATAEPTI